MSVEPSIVISSKISLVIAPSALVLVSIGPKTASTEFPRFDVLNCILFPSLPVLFVSSLRALLLNEAVILIPSCAIF